MSATFLTVGLALSFLIYTYIGYPLLLVLFARLFPWRPCPATSWEPTVSICVAAYNSAAYVDAKLRSLAATEPDERGVQRGGLAAHRYASTGESGFIAGCQ